MKKNIFLHVLLMVNIAMSGYIIWQNNNLSKSITYSGYDIERIEPKLNEIDKKVESVHGLTTSIYLKADQ